jgi:hypothetical protein
MFSRARIVAPDGAPRASDGVARLDFDIVTVFAGILVPTMFALLLDLAVTKFEARLSVWRPRTAETELP